jgi:hypothetical protein
MTIAWCITECIRYAYYALNLLNVGPSFLIWCRYVGHPMAKKMNLRLQMPISVKAEFSDPGLQNPIECRTAKLNIFCYL